MLNESSRRIKMYKIVNAKELTTNIYLFEVEAKRVAKSCMPGQFVIVRMDEDSERIPLTISDYNRETGTVTIVVQTIGAGTNMMKNLKNFLKKSIFHMIYILTHIQSIIKRKYSNYLRNYMIMDIYMKK